MNEHLDAQAADHRRLRTIDEAAVRLGVTPRFIRKLVADRRISHRKVGRLVRFTEIDLRAYVESVRVDVASRRAAS